MSRSPYIVACSLLLFAGGAVPRSLAAETTVQPMTPESELLPSDAPWARVLDEFHGAGGLDYAGLQSKPVDLDTYLAGLAGARPSEASREERIAFWCNAYNAVTVRFVLEGYPEVESVKAVPGFFDTKTFLVAGEELTLDKIEARALAEGDPRVHFAVVCASTSCPDLRFEPYRGAELEEQLEDQTRSFLSDTEKGLRIDQDAIWLSSIFKWYAGDFTGGSTVVAFFARSKVLNWIRPYLSEDLAEELDERQPPVRYLDYDWSLNDR